MFKQTTAALWCSSDMRFVAGADGNQGLMTRGHRGIHMEADFITRRLLAVLASRITAPWRLLCATDRTHFRRSERRCIPCIAWCWRLFTPAVRFMPLTG